MKTAHDSATDRTVRAAARLYVAPRAVIGFLLLATLGLATFLVVIQIAIVLLHRLGA